MKSFFKMEFVYSPQTLSQSKSNKFVDQAFGSDNNLTKRDWSDSTTAAYNYLLHQQDNALQVDLMNYQNRYNSPQNQMLLRQAAGINPYSDYAVQGAVSPGVSSSPVFRSQGTASRKAQATAAQVNSLLNTLETGSKIYDYMVYGRDLSKYQLNAAVGRSQIVSEEVQQALMNTGMQAWTLGYPGYDWIGDSPYGVRYGKQTHNYDVTAARVAAYQKQINYLVDQLYPSQKERNEALKQLDDQKYGIQGAQSGTWIHTGNPTADGILQFLLMMFRDSIHFGFSGRL